MNSHVTTRWISATALRLLVVVFASQFWLAEPAVARNCTATEKSAADAQLWLNKRDTAAALARHLPWGVPQPATDRILVQRDYVIGYSDSLLVPLWTAHRLDSTGLGDVARADCFRRAPRIPAPTASLPSDYNEPIYDQGHLTPNGDMSHKLTPVLNSFVLSNMAPQHCQFKYPDRQCQQRRRFQRTAARPVDGSVPAKIAVQILRGYTLEAAHPILEPGVITIDVLNVIDAGDDPYPGRQIDRAVRDAEHLGGCRQGAADGLESPSCKNS